MITYFVKTLLCAVVMFLIYVLLLEKEKMHRFNRFYLLFSIAFSLTVSFITIKTPLPVVTVNELIAPTRLSNIAATLNGFDKLSHLNNPPTLTAKGSTTTDLLKTPTPIPTEKSIPWNNILVGLYISGTAFFLFRFIRNLYLLLIKAAHNKKNSYREATLVLTKDNSLPHSFLKYIFIDQEKFERGTIEKEILQHELTHVNQKHSIDILLVELIIVFAWINPLLFLFRKAIMLNHEYLADDAVVHTFNNTESYRLLLFNTVSQSNNLVLSSPFNYLTTKKRLIMMTKNTSRKVALLKQIALIPLIAAIGFLFSTQVIAQDKSKQLVTQNRRTFSKTDAPQSVVEEYHALLAKYDLKVDTVHDTKKDSAIKTKTPQKPEWAIYTKGIDDIDPIKKITQADRAQLEQLYFQLSKKQQCRENFGFYAKPEYLTKLVPSKAQLESWKDSKTYGIWINTRRAKNSVLNSHSNTDFNCYAIRKLDKAAAKMMKYQIEIALRTVDAFKKYNEIQASRWKINPDDKYEMVFQAFSKKYLAEVDAEKQ
jgi:bla regulator protein BlaR1